MEPIEPLEPAAGALPQKSQDTDSSVVVFEDLQAPDPADPTPPVYARWLGLLAVAISGLLGGLIGYGTGDLMGGQTWALVGMVIGAATAAIGVGIMVSLTLRAMNEWETAQHPEAKQKAAKRNATTKAGLAQLAEESRERSQLANSEMHADADEANE